MTDALATDKQITELLRLLGFALHHDDFHTCRAQDENERRNDISLAMVIVDSDGSHDVQVGHSDC
jgi:hypothetical protein